MHLYKSYIKHIIAIYAFKNQGKFYFCTHAPSRLDIIPIIADKLKCGETSSLSTIIEQIKSNIGLNPNDKQPAHKLNKQEKEILFFDLIQGLKKINEYFLVQLQEKKLNITETLRYITVENMTKKEIRAYPFIYLTWNRACADAFYDNTKYKSDFCFNIHGHDSSERKCELCQEKNISECKHFISLDNVFGKPGFDTIPTNIWYLLKNAEPLAISQI